ncbi:MULTISPECIES: type III secretion protein HrpB2 [Ralstonia solanacearum species complex]|uniref:Hrpj protein n=3 Tax=Ralstonia solanacearum TaxID=305 RepID=A0A7U7PQR7_RALSL|nr:type III secretion protein HrpB2 [Ralstonia solanacearum]AEG71821.1 hrpj protein [Ralstonia solanacearum Po82]ALF90358.1 Bacterial type III secretion protein (HrpB2) [Ralstonia solanacearum]AMP71698.1 type III secretion protein HrpJ [Ralstonia solanacearum]AMP76373.1 type III secretion protein HrpJ [Ralstonia solanacearum]ATI29825.1 type III secretion protein HrpB2 [Ralstonia solanacearum]
MIQGPTAIPPVATHPVDTPALPSVQQEPVQELVSRFEALLGHAKDAHRQSKGPSAIGELVAKEDAAVRATADRINATLETDKVKPMEEIMVDAMRIQMEAAATMTKIHMGSMVAHSGKNAVQTLMKNQ